MTFALWNAIKTKYFNSLEKLVCPVQHSTGIDLSPYLHNQTEDIFTQLKKRMKNAEF